MKYSTLYYEIDFVLDNFAQLPANVSVLSMLKASQAQLWRLGVLNVFSTYDIFNLKQWVYQDITPSQVEEDLYCKMIITISLVKIHHLT